MEEGKLGIGLTRPRKVLTGWSFANTGEVDIQDGSGIESRKKVGDDVSILKIGLNARDAESGVRV